MNKQQFTSACESITKALYSIEIIANKMQYDVRFDESVTMYLMDTMKRFNHTMGSSLALVSAISDSTKKSKNDEEFNFAFISISNNLAILLAPMIPYLEDCLDTYAACSTDASTGELLDSFVHDINILHESIIDLIEPFVSDETKVMAEAVKTAERKRMSNENNDDFDDFPNDNFDNFDNPDENFPEDDQPTE